MSAVRNWLEEIGLAQYADAFEANDIDTDLLTQIDDQVFGGGLPPPAEHPQIRSGEHLRYHISLRAAEILLFVQGVHLNIFDVFRPKDADRRRSLEHLQKKTAETLRIPGLRASKALSVWLEHPPG